MKLEINRSRPIAPQIAGQIAVKVASGELAVDHELPSVRKLAKGLGVAPMTVVKAYEELRSRGLLQSVRGSGTRVARPAPPEDNLPRFRFEGSAIDMSRGIPDPETEAIPDVFPHILAEIKTNPATRTYVESRIPSEYRTAVAELLGTEGFPVEPSQIVATQGSAHGLSILLETLSLPGDRVAIEVPGRKEILRWARELRRLPIPIGRLGGELDLEAVEAALRRGTKLVIVGPDVSGATGDCLSARCRQRLASLVATAGALLVEDRSFSRLHYAGTPSPVAEIEPSCTVIVDSFSFCASPGLRLGYLCAPAALAERLSDQVCLRDAGGTAMIQMGVARWLRGDGLSRHLADVVPVYRRRHEVTAAALEAQMPPNVHWSNAEGGFNLWISLPAGQFADLTERARGMNVLIAPGSAFVDRDSDHGFRLSFGALSETQIDAGVSELAGLFREQLKTN